MHNKPINQRAFNRQRMNNRLSGPRWIEFVGRRWRIMLVGRRWRVVMRGRADASSILLSGKRSRRSGTRRLKEWIEFRVPQPTSAYDHPQCHADPTRCVGQGVWVGQSVVSIESAGQTEPLKDTTSRFLKEKDHLPLTVLKNI